MAEKAPVRRKKYQKNKKLGLCPRCGNKKRKTCKFSYCDDCREYFRNYNAEASDAINENRKAVYAERKANHQCPRCGKKLGKRYKKILCETCHDKQYQYNYGKVRK